MSGDVTHLWRMTVSAAWDTHTHGGGASSRCITEDVREDVLYGIAVFFSVEYRYQRVL